MAGAADPAGLARARDVVAAVMKHKHARLLFNQPVDASLFADYRKIIRRPMDLSTVMARLREAEASGWQHGTYSTPADVLADVSLIWSNCNTFNSTPADAPTRHLCAEVKAFFDKKWEAAGLAAASPAAKAHTPGASGRSSEHAVDQRFTAGQGVNSCTPRRQSCLAVMPFTCCAVFARSLQAASATHLMLRQVTKGQRARHHWSVHELTEWWPAQTRVGCLCACWTASC